MTDTSLIEENAILMDTHDENHEDILITTHEEQQPLQTLESNLTNPFDILFQEVLTTLPLCCNNWMFTIIRIPPIVNSVSYLIYQNKKCFKELDYKWNFSFYDVVAIAVSLLLISMFSFLLYNKKYRYTMNRKLYYSLYYLNICINLMLIVGIPVLAKKYPKCQFAYTNIIICIIIVEGIITLTHILIVASYIYALYTYLKNMNKTIYEQLNIPFEILTLVDTDKECAICLDNYNNNDDKQIVKLICDHTYHDHCIQRWFNSIKKRNIIECPICRRIVTIIEV